MNHQQQARQAFRQGDPQSAVHHFQAWLKKNPQDASAFHDLAASWFKLGNLPAAEKAVKNALAINKGFAKGWSLLASIQSAQGQIGTPLSSILMASRLAPENQKYRARLGMILIDQGHFEHAEKTFAIMLKEDPDQLDAIAGLATVWDRKGQFEDAYRLMAGHLHRTDSHATLASTWSSVCRQLGHHQEAVDVLLRMLRGRGPSLGRALILSELGNLYDHMGNTALAFEAHTRANGDRLGTWDPRRLEKWVDRLIAAFTVQQCQAGLHVHNDQERPILIVGMPRSGTSLVEQILSSHPAVHGEGELEDLRVTTLFAEKQLQQRFPECVERVDPKLMASLSEWYLNRRVRRSSGAQWSTDKMPQNFQYIGWAMMLLPHARIIHCARDPMDTVLSCYFQAFKSSLAWSNRLDWLGHYYRQYQRIMAHWERVSPQAFYTLQYETLVSQPEPTIRALLEHCSIPFDPAVLRHQHSERVIATASYAQANQPIYTSSAGKAARYGRQLQSVTEMLGVS